MAGWPQISIDVRREYSQCFGCGKDNPIGLKLSFERYGKTARTEFTPSEHHQGWPGLVHGGIIMCLLDEAMGWIVLFEGMNCVTADIEAKLRCPVAIDETLVITAHITRKTRKLVDTRAAVTLKDGTLVAEGKGRHFVTNYVNSRDDSKENAGD